MSIEKENFLRTRLVPLLQQLNPSTSPKWGKMDVQQMIEHYTQDAVSVASGRIKIDEISQEFEGKIRGFDKNENLIIEINGTEHLIKIVEIKTDRFEFIFDNTFHEVKLNESTSTELKLILDNMPMILKKHSKLSEIIEKSNALSGGANSQNTISSQIPGRVISIAINKGDTVKQGDNIVVLESMKMQVAIKSHRDGTIRELKVKEGQSISRNDVVAILE